MSNSNQEIIEARLATFVDGELDSSERAEIEQHLQHNPQYRRLLDELRKGREMLRSIPREAAPPDFAEAFANQLERSVLLDNGPDRSTAGPRMRIGVSPRIVAAAAIVFLTVGLAAIVYFVLPGRNTRLVVLDNSSRVSVPAAPMSSPVDVSVGDDMAKSKAAGDADESEEVAPTLEKKFKDDEVAKSAPTDVPDAASTQPGIANSGLGEKGTSLQFQTDNPASNDLDQLARNVSQDSQVKDLLSGATWANVRPALEPAAANDAIVMVVRSRDLPQLQSALKSYFGSNNVDWQSAPPPVELALNNSLAQQNAQTSNRNSAVARLKSDAGGGSAGDNAVRRQMNEPRAREVSLVKPGEPEDAVKDKASDLRTTDARSQTRPSSSSNSGLAKSSPGSFSKGTDAPNAPASIKPSASASALDGVQHDSALGDRINADQIPPTSSAAMFGHVQAPATVDNLYVVRRLSRQQAQELTECLTRNGAVSKADVYRGTLDEKPNNPDGAISNRGVTDASTSIVGPTSRTFGAAAVEDESRLGSRRPTVAASASKPVSSFDKESARRDELVSRKSAAPAGPTTRSVDPIVQKGDDLRLRYAAKQGMIEQSEVVKVKEDGTISPQRTANLVEKKVAVAGKRVSEVEKALLTPGAAPGAKVPVVSATAVKVERLESAAAGTTSARGAGSAVVTGGSTRPTTQPIIGHALSALSSRADDVSVPSPTKPTPIPSPAIAAGPSGTIDVVIVVQKEVTSTQNTTPVPATQMGQSARSIPTTQPVVPRPGYAPSK